MMATIGVYVLVTYVAFSELSSDKSAGMAAASTMGMYNAVEKMIDPRLAMHLMSTVKESET